MYPGRYITRQNEDASLLSTVETGRMKLPELVVCLLSANCRRNSMSQFLDQDEIDRLQYELVQINSKKEKSISAKEKIKDMYYNILNKYCNHNLDTIENIGQCINEINSQMKTSSEYYQSFTMLKNSHTKRIR